MIYDAHVVHAAAFVNTTSACSSTARFFRTGDTVPRGGPFPIRTNFSRRRRSSDNKIPRGGHRLARRARPPPVSINFDRAAFCFVVSGAQTGHAIL